MSSLFSKPETPKPPPPPPTVDEAAKARDEADRMNRRKGRAAALITGSSGTGSPTTAAKTLTGG